jgi:hypothetical protein
VERRKNGGNKREGKSYRGKLYRRNKSKGTSVQGTCDGQTRVTGQKEEEQGEEQERRETRTRGNTCSSRGNMCSSSGTHEEAKIKEGGVWGEISRVITLCRRKVWRISEQVCREQA